MTRKPLVFVDFEASSLDPGGFPVEIGWVGEDGQGEGYLIRPAPGWKVWSAASQKIHGIPMETLLREGRPHDVVARRAAAAFAGRTVVVSAPAWDGEWLRMLLDSAGITERFPILDSDLAEMAAAAPLLELFDGEDKSPLRYRTERLVRDLMQEIAGSAHDDDEMRSKVAHRALADAEQLWRTWRMVGERARAALAKVRASGGLEP